MAQTILSDSRDSVSNETMFSIITATYNCKSKLDRTLKSVLSQSFADFEYLVMDGGSKDGSKEWLEEIQDPRVKACSEPDKGVYDAMNKGIQRARGKYLFFLGAGDELLPGALEEMSRHLPKTGAVMMYGDVLWDGKMVYAGEFSKIRLCEQNICHQAIFCSREVFRILGGFELKYRALADWVCNMKCFGNRRIQVRYVPVKVAIFELGGLSGKGDPEFNADRMMLIKRHLGWLTYLRYAWPESKKLVMAKLYRAKQLLRPLVPPIILKARRKLSHRFRGH